MPAETELRPVEPADRPVPASKIDDDQTAARPWLPALALVLLSVVWLRLFWHRLSEPVLIHDDFELIRR